MKRFSEAELKEKADIIMAAHKIEKVYATEDGEIFLPADKSLADDHNYKNVKGEVKLISNEKPAESFMHVISEEDIKTNPDMTDQGLKPGDEIEVAVIPGEEENVLEEEHVKQQKTISAAGALAGKLRAAGTKVAEIRAELKKKKFAADVIAIVTTPEALRAS